MHKFKASLPPTLEEMVPDWFDLAQKRKRENELNKRTSTRTFSTV